MLLTLLGTILGAQSLPREPKSLPKAAKIEQKTHKKGCLKTSCFQIRFFHGLEVVFDSFFKDFWKPKFAKIAKTPFLRKPEK